ncbi:MAG: 4-(cytidine 5'-diphospho)-2-C-methyl-D-erythritol kinase [Pseudomonadota bacterium]
MKSRPAPAKINLALHVTSQRADGYHLLDTVVCFADPTFSTACDEVRMQEAAEDSFTITGPEAEGLDVGADNLVLQAVRALRAQGHPVPSVQIDLVKNLPVASGIGGGSADAAAALYLANDLSSNPALGDMLHRIGLTLGADVPMCLANQPLQATGIGEDLSEIVMPALNMVLVNPRIGVSTPSVFKALTAKENAPLSPTPPLTVDFVAWLTRQRNDLEAPARALCPAIGTVLAALAETSGNRLARMSGSGATCFGLYRTMDEANVAARTIAKSYPHWWVVALKTGSTPALPMEFDR